MSDTLQRKVLDVFVSKVLEFFADKTKDELIEILTKDDLKKILFKTMKKFTESDYYKQEFNNSYQFYDDGGKYIMDNIQNDNINPSLTVEELNHNLSDLIDVYFQGDNDKSYLLNQIVTNYRANASIKITLFDLLVQQQDFYKQTVEQLEIHTRLLNEVKNQGEESKSFKKLILKESINKELQSILLQISNQYLYFVLKKSPTFSGDDLWDIKARKNAIHQIQAQMDNLVDEDFYKNPVRALIPSQETFEQFFNNNKLITKNIPYYQFCEYQFKGLIIEKINNVLDKYKTFLPDEFILLLFDLEKQLKSPIFETGLQYGLDISKLTVVSYDFQNCRKILSEIGDTIIKLMDFIE